MDRSDIEEIVSRRLCNFETAIPAKVTAVNNDGTIAVVALIKKVSMDGIVDNENLVMDGVKLFQFGNSSTSIELEVEKGSQVMLFGLSRHGREWLNSKSDNAVIPKSPLGNTMNDLFAIPLFRTDRDNGKSGKIVIGVDGKVSISSKHGQTIRLNTDGSIDINPKSGSTVKIDGFLEVTKDAKFLTDTASVTFSTHIHPTPVGPSTPPSPDGV